MADTLVLPVMDGIPDSSTPAKPPRIDAQLVRAFAASVRSIHQYRCSNFSTSNLSIQNTPNLGEPLFGDSAYSALMQMVDLVSYLLHQIERQNLLRNIKRRPLAKRSWNARVALTQSWFTAGLVG